MGTLKTQDSTGNCCNFIFKNWKHIKQTQLLNSQQQLEEEVRNQQSRELEQQSGEREQSRELETQYQGHLNQQL